MPSFAYALAASFLLLAIGLGAWGASRGGGDDGQILYAQTDAQQRSLQVTYLPSRDIAILNTTLPPLPNDRTYQAWSITNGQPRSIGLLRATGPNAFDIDLSGADSIALTVEPAGGSSAPTTEPFLETRLQEG